MKQPHIHVPQPEPDESLHSLLIAAFRFSGHANFRDFTELIFRRPSDGRGWSWRYKSIGYYLDPCRKTGLAILQGTLQLPYLVPFTDPEVARQGENRLDGETRTDPVALRSAWKANNGRPLNYCPICVALHVRRIGRSLWLRSHQLHHVNVCWRHAVRLIRVQQRFGSPLLPHEFENQKAEYCFNKSDIWWAQQARELLLANHGPSLAEHRREVYRNRAMRLGYVKSGRIDAWAIASDLEKRFDRALFERVCGSFNRERLAGIVHRVVSGQESGIQPSNHILCIDALFGEQNLFFQQLRNVQSGQKSEGQPLSGVSGRQDRSALVHREIFMRELGEKGRDVMRHLDDQFPLTHSWILQNALAWSRRKIAQLGSHSPERVSILRTAALGKRFEETVNRNSRIGVLSAIGSESYPVVIPIYGGDTSEHGFYGLADGLISS
ncbi:TniQ family protein [Hylemonella gracilis]|uniref:TniQ family protein n=1 Tax=Hylemonella gracilis TaxID=80880 RepID=UPI0018CC57D1|nr:TniQ family protein [Hylemonella gracilis]